MIVYRLAISAYKNDLSGNGAKLYGGRWNPAGIAVLYCTENISLAVLEILIRTGKDTIPRNYFLMKLNIPNTLKIISLNKSHFNADWKEDTTYTQWLGSEFIKNSQAAVLKIPSAIVDEEHNFICNPAHNDFQKIKITASKKFEFDKRLYLKNE